MILLGRQTKLMAVLNLTPDSFSQDGLLRKKLYDTSYKVAYAQKLIKEGGDIVDVGGESTRPESRRVAISEELKRTIPTIRLLAKKTKIPISIDTYKPEVAEQALDSGASIVNNIKGTNLTKSMLQVIKKYDAAVILMHIHGNPKTMQKHIFYKDVVQEIINALRKSIEKCLESGIKSDKIIIDPGIGFGKTVEHNLKIIRHLSDLKILKKPILIGASRKSFIGKILQKDVSGRIMGTAASVCAAIFNGAHIIRIHDVKKMKEAATMADAFLSINENKMV
ncbi:MAG: dihydropteroate synthase [Candidatus Aceula meridiana]|nr:dihydropteroate synthase [Candidatus Aceula meridiana]